MWQHDPAHSADASCSSITPSDVARLRPSWFVSTHSSVMATPTVAGGTVFVGDSAGTFYAIDQRTGALRWSFSILAPANRCTIGGTIPPDRHAVSYGEIASTAAVADIPGTGTSPTVFFGGGGTLYALDASTGQCRWAQNLDPTNPTSGMEVLSSPVVDMAASPPEVIVGDDSNETPGPGIGPPGVQAFDAATGALLWKFEPENLSVVHSLFNKTEATDGCGDVWSSPALDPSALGGEGLVVFGTGNCPDPAAAAPGDPRIQGVYAVNATTGALQWDFFEPPNQYSNQNEPDEGDDDFGSSPVITRVPTPGGGTRSLVIQAGKSGYLYALDEATGTEVWSVQAAQPGQTGNALAGAIGGFIGSIALGTVRGQPALFALSAIPGPLAGAGLTGLGTSHPGVEPDVSLVNDPLRAVSLHAIDTADGAVLWQDALATPSYAATTYANGVVFAPSTTSFSVAAYDANTGLPMWTYPTGAAVSSGMAIVGSTVFVGAGTNVSGGLAPVTTPVEVPPELNGIWAFDLGMAHGPRVLQRASGWSRSGGSRKDGAGP